MFLAMATTETDDETGNKEKFIRIRVDDTLKRALGKAADKSRRKEADQARYILEVALGLIEPEDTAVQERLAKIKPPDVALKKEAPTSSKEHRKRAG